MFTRDRVNSATAGMSSAKVAKPWRWNVSAPRCLPRPMAIILSRPLSTGPLKSVCGLTRLIGMMTSASSWAWRSMKTGIPPTSPILTVSMLERISQPIVASRMPSDARTSSWPSAVAPPWLPMAGTTNTSAPAARTAVTAARVTSAIRSIPRLPTARQTRWPGRIVPSTVANAARTASSTSAISPGRSAWWTSAQFGSWSCRNTSSGSRRLGLSAPITGMSSVRSGRTIVSLRSSSR